MNQLDGREGPRRLVNEHGQRRGLQPFHELGEGLHGQLPGSMSAMLFPVLRGRAAKSIHVTLAGSPPQSRLSSLNEGKAPAHRQRLKQGRTDRSCDLFEIVTWFDPFDNRCHSGASSRSDAMDIIFEVVSVRTFWRILLFVHFLLAVALLAAVTL